MGTWGYGIQNDDLVADMLDAFDEQLKRGASVADASASILRQYEEPLRDEDIRPLVWLALAHAQWTYGQLDPGVLEQVRTDVRDGAGLDRWREASESALQKRQAALNRFLKHIETPNPRPKRRPRFIVRKPPFAPGDCLSVELPNGQYGALLVLAADHSNPEYGKNLVATLDYMEPVPPDMAVFEARRWFPSPFPDLHGEPRLDVAWYLTAGLRTARKRIRVVGQVSLRPSDPTDSGYFSTWWRLCFWVIRQREKEAT